MALEPEVTPEEASESRFTRLISGDRSMTIVNPIKKDTMPSQPLPRHPNFESDEYDIDEARGGVSSPDIGTMIRDGIIYWDGAGDAKLTGKVLPNSSNSTFTFTTEKQPDPVSERAKVLREAEGLITGDRNVSYGTPSENFKNIAAMWNTRYKHKLKDDEEFTGSDVADAMMLLKIARNIAQPKRDNAVDIAGYAACGYEALLDEQSE